MSENSFGYPLNTQNSEYCPIIAPNSRYLVFQSNRPGGMGGMDVWISENKNFRNRSEKPIWSDPMNFRELNTPDFEGPFTIRFDKNGLPLEIFFTSRKSPISGRDGLKGLNIYTIKNLTRKNPATDSWSKPEHILEFNSHFDDKMPAISPDGKSLVFASNRPGGFGGFDLWISNRDLKINKWSSPINLGPKINSSANEIMPSYHYDGQTLFFSSDRLDENFKFSFYMADFDDDSLILTAEEEKKRLENDSPPVFPKVRTLKKLPQPLSSEHDDEGISLSHDGLWIYYASNRPGGEGQFDIYRAPVTEAMRKPYSFDLSGVILDGSEKTMIGLDSTIRIYNEKGLLRVITSKRIGGDIAIKSEDEPVNFRTRLLTGTRYKFEVSSPGFHPNEFSLDLTGTIGRNKSKYVKVILMPITEEPEDIKKPDNNSTDPEVPQYTRVILRDGDSKKFLVEGKVILYSDDQKGGYELSRDQEFFVLKEFPPGDFELTGSATGYTTETIVIKKENTELRDQKEIIVDLNRLSNKATIYQNVILFNFSESTIRPEEMPKLKATVAYLSKNKDRIEIGGHTDNIDSKEFNVKLSLKRAEVIKQYLVDHGISEDRIETRGYWYSQPVESNETPEGRAKNRRVTFKRLEK
ncbi:MAG: PD40 domain-containing protein [Leptospiraceae bacterium]|nr:PD40 domain-containing protein [Leptospiraceae bacterium]